uniref:tRNA methyltransferase 2 homolog B n=1 Tax=Sinocyclocheilus anshuiensis TaxID=1608454 RepID=A0A671PPX0_9TELE
MSHAYKTMRLQLTWPLLKQIIIIPKTCFSYSITSRCAVNTGCKLVKRRKERKPRLPADWHTLSWEERLADNVTPLWRMSYEEQLQWKQEQQNNILLEMTKQLAQDSIDGYHNKSTFSVNRGVVGNPKTAGFYISNGKTDNIDCVHGDHLLNMSSKHKMVARHYEDFIHLSPLKPCRLFHDGGHWREITIRTNSAGHTMPIVYFHPQTLTPEEIGVHKAALVEYFTQGPGAVCQLDSLYFQETTMTRCSHEQSPYQLLHGQSHIFEEVLGFGEMFRISADSFFQVNRGAAETLYKTLAELNRACVGGTLLDVCCGTGAIGISLSPQMERVIGKAEVVLPNLMATLNCDGGLTAGVNPSRAAIRRLVYISCKPDGEAMRNFRGLCCSSDYKTPTMAVPVDLFPHTPHCELVLVFER